MATIILERFNSRPFTDSVDRPSADLLYQVHEADTPEEVQTIVLATKPSTFLGLDFAEYSADPLGGGIWDVTVKYGRNQISKETDTEILAFDTSGATTRITQSLETIERYNKFGKASDPPPPFPIPGEWKPADFHGAIGVTKDRVEGVEIGLAGFAFTITRYAPAESVTLSYMKSVQGVTWTVNDAEFKGWDKGEVLFKGARGSRRNAENWEITYNFEVKSNASGLTVGKVPDKIEEIEKEGHQYLWVSYEESEDTDAVQMVQRPLTAIVERVYEYGNFGVLGLGE